MCSFSWCMRLILTTVWFYSWKAQHFMHTFNEYINVIFSCRCLIAVSVKVVFFLCVLLAECHTVIILSVLKQNFNYLYLWLSKCNGYQNASDMFKWCNNSHIKISKGKLSFCVAAFYRCILLRMLVTLLVPSHMHSQIHPVTSCPMLLKVALLSAAIPFETCFLF